jgi:hypothetical protein
VKEIALANLISRKYLHQRLKELSTSQAMISLEVGFLQLDIVCSYNAYNRKILGHERLVGLIFSALGNTVAVFSIFEGDSNTETDTDTADFEKTTFNNASSKNIDIENPFGIDQTSIDNADMWCSNVLKCENVDRSFVCDRKTDVQQCCITSCNGPTQTLQRDCRLASCS